MEGVTGICRDRRSLRFLAYLAIDQEQARVEPQSRARVFRRRDFEVFRLNFMGFTLTRV